MVAIVAISVLFRCALLVASGGRLLFVDVLPFCAFDGIAIGGLICVIAENRNSRLAKTIPRVSIIAFVAYAASVIWVLKSHSTPLRLRLVEECGLTSIAVAFSGLIFAASANIGGPIGSFLGLRFLTYIGGISYGIYLTHDAVPMLLAMVAHRLQLTALSNALSHEPVRLIVYLSVTLVTAALCWHFIERPFNEWKARFPYVGEAAAPSMRGLTRNAPATSNLS